MKEQVGGWGLLLEDAYRLTAYIGVLTQWLCPNSGAASFVERALRRCGLRRPRSPHTEGGTSDVKTGRSGLRSVSGLRNKPLTSNRTAEGKYMEPEIIKMQPLN